MTTPEYHTSLHDLGDTIAQALMSSAADDPFTSGRESSKRCVGWIADRNGIVVQCPEQVPPNRRKYHSQKCAQRTWEWGERGLRLGDPLKRLGKVCAQCHKEFATSIRSQKFCSEKCRDKDHYIRHRQRYEDYTRNYRKEHPEKARQACRRYYGKHKKAENAKTRARYAEKKRKLEDADRVLAAHQLLDWHKLSESQRIAGAYLICAPGPVSNKELAAVVGKKNDRAFEMWAFRLRRKVKKPGGPRARVNLQIAPKPGLS